ncbi:uncharacterized protein LOC133732777 [Rosa rugosa]|uniref:uncharacterized protein LOC133732777 n=1 Tax=Rosa rugosa TaxID=74645 RepID=UPI002B41351E|nr:uncharacterized protein LOC133732777 [Rosa rugosa]
MDSGLSSLIGVAPPPPPPPLSSETASQRWRRLCGLLKNRKPSKEEKFGLRVAVLSIYAKYQFINGIDNLDLDSQDEEQTETTEEANVPSRYYCYQCRQVVSVTVDVEMTCPLCHGGWIQECSTVGLLYLNMPSESEHSASDSDGQGTILIHPSSPTVIDIVEDSYGSDPNPNRSPFHSTGLYDYNNYDESHQATGNYDSSLEQGLLTLSIDANIVANQPHHGTGVTTSVWIFSATGFAFEAVSAFFDQVSTPRKPQYSLYGMLLSIVAVLVCILDLIHNALIQRLRGLTSASNILWGILPEIFGLALAFIQCISSALQFLFLYRHAANPMKISLVPFLFFFVLFAFKYREGRNRG